MTVARDLLDMAVRAGFATLAWLLAATAGAALHAAWYAVDRLRHQRDTARTHARIARHAERALATGQAVLNIGPPHRPTPTPEQLRAMFPDAPTGTGEEDDR